MESEEILKLFFSLIINCNCSNIKIWRGLEKAELVINEIQTKKNLYHIIIGLDRPAEECWHKVDHWLTTQSETYTVFLLDENFLDIKKNQSHLQKIKTIPFNHDLISNLSTLREVKNVYHFDFDNQTTRWLCLNRISRPQRRYFIDNWVEKIQQNLIYSDGINRPIGNVDFYKDQSSYFCNAKNLLALADIYNQTSGSIVTETKTDSFLTEKTFHPIMALHPILMIGPRFAIDHLRSQGFDVFDDLIDHSYDKLESWQERIDRLVNDNLNILKNGIDRRAIANRLIYNQNHIWNYYDWLIKNAKDSFIQLTHQATLPNS
jgi:hypothetical protein